MLQLWRQGDAILDGAPPFVFLADMAQPLSEPARGQAFRGATGIDVVDVPGPGIVVMSQTCNILRSCADRPYVEVSPLVLLQADVMKQVRGGYRPRYAALSGLTDRDLAVDLDRTMSIEKSILIPFTDSRIVGVGSEQEAMRFAEAAARARNRAALPSAFNKALEPIRQRVIAKIGKNSPEGRFLARVAEIRVRPFPTWKEVEHVEVLFVYERLSDVPADADAHIEKLLARFITSDTFSLPIGRAVSLETLPAADYLASDKLDLEHLSYQG